MAKIRITHDPKTGKTRIEGENFQGCDQVIDALKKGLKIDKAPIQRNEGGQEHGKESNRNYNVQGS